jgi:prephenate dehydrogenase
MTDPRSEVALPPLTGPVEVVGAGLIGTSIALVCSRLGIDVVLRDTSEENVRTAHGLGAGRAARPGDRPQLVVVAVPPAAVGAAIVDALARTAAVVTDVGSVKAAPLEEVAARVGADDLARYVGSHPMAGSERSGPLAASAALFDGRPWAVTPHPLARPDAVRLVEALVLECGAAPIVMEPTEHDQAVARISHLPHLAAVLVAGRLATAPAEHLALSGQGVRDVTRVAASDPELWQQILEANSEAVLDLLAEVRADLDALMTAVASDAGPDLVEILTRGNAGTAAIPGKHGGPARPTRSVFVAVPDHPGELARLFGDAGEIGVNIEDVHIDHDPGRPVGLTELVVERGSAERLLAALESRGWTTHR